LVQIHWTFVKKIVWLISRSSVNMRHLTSKLRHTAYRQLNTLQATASVQKSLTFVRKIIQMLCKSGLNIGHLVSKPMLHSPHIDEPC
jgi:hypothetical protein